MQISATLRRNTPCQKAGGVRTKALNRDYTSRTFHFSENLGICGIASSSGPLFGYFPDYFPYNCGCLTGSGIGMIGQFITLWATSGKVTNFSCRILQIYRMSPLRDVPAGHPRPFVLWCGFWFDLFKAYLLNILPQLFQTTEVCRLSFQALVLFTEKIPSYLTSLEYRNFAFIFPTFIGLQQCFSNPSQQRLSKSVRIHPPGELKRQTPCRTKKCGGIYLVTKPHPPVCIKSLESMFKRSQSAFGQESCQKLHFLPQKASQQVFGLICENATSPHNPFRLFSANRRSWAQSQSLCSLYSNTPWHVWTVIVLGVSLPSLCADAQSSQDNLVIASRHVPLSI